MFGKVFRLLSGQEEGQTRKNVKHEEVWNYNHDDLFILCRGISFISAG